MDFTKCVTLMGALLFLGAFLPSEACKCDIVDHLQMSFCNSPAAAKVIFLKKSNKGPKSKSNENGIGYDARIIEVMKGEPALKDSKFIENPMVGTSCEYDHSKGDYKAPYLVIGSVTNGNLVVGGCNLPTQWSKLTAEQIEGLNKAYKTGCGKCEIIKPCDSPPCKPARNQCILVDENQKNNQACLPGSYGACAWKTISY